MSKDTSIEWADSTLNPMMGCDGCELWNLKRGISRCYAGQLTQRYGGKSKGYPEFFSKPTLFLDRLLIAQAWTDLTGKPRKDKPWLNGLPRCIFLNDMGDTFTESLPLDWMANVYPELGGKSPLEILGSMKAIVMLLTKRPSRMRQFFESRLVPSNFMLMTSVTSAATLGRVKDLLAINCRWRGISYEPTWGPVDWDGVCWPWGAEGARVALTSRIHWIIFGGESGQKKYPVDLAWARSTRDHCVSNGIPFFMKQVDKVQEIPADLMVRQMPQFSLFPPLNHCNCSGPAHPIGSIGCTMQKEISNAI